MVQKDFHYKHVVFSELQLNLELSEVIGARVYRYFIPPGLSSQIGLLYAALLGRERSVLNPHPPDLLPAV